MREPRIDNLDILYWYLARLAERRPPKPYRVPALWNSWGYAAARRSRSHEITVDPRAFLLDCLEQIILPARGRRHLAGRSLSRLRGIRPTSGGRVVDEGIRRGPGDWIRGANIYAMLVRTTSAWDHDGDGRLLPTKHWTETGTFLKSILLLPLLARLGINAIYLLPVAKISQTFRKGEIGCPYAARSFFQLEPDLHDRLLDADAGLRPRWVPPVEVEFGAFVEAAHALGIRVLVDLAPRTASRDSDLILDHPDWFYWIDARRARDYGPPYVEGHKPGIPKPAELEDILGRDVLREHLSRFRPSPSAIAPARWKQFAKQCRAHPPRDLVRAIGREFGVITPPGFSDCLNDPQPPWSDVTFLRLYLDHPAASVKHLAAPARQPPYVFTDTIKSSRFPGRRPNRPLWTMLADILPFYQRFGIDGARVDMGHALPPELQRMIISRPKRTDPDFCFFAEELNYTGGPVARRDGYNAFIGSAWYLEARHANGELHRFVRDILPRAVLPALASAETPDTPRAATRNGGSAFARMIAVLNNFLPSAIPFVNSGLELFERQPLNLGLDMQPPGRFALPRRDPYYGKLGYFDRVALHWNNAGAREMIDLLGRAAALRRRFIADLVVPRNCFFPKVSPSTQSIIALAWRVGEGRKTMLVFASTDFRHERRCTLHGMPAKAARRSPCETLLEIHPAAQPPRPMNGKLRLALPPGDVKVLLL